MCVVVTSSYHSWVRTSLLIGSYHFTPYKFAKECFFFANIYVIMFTEIIADNNIKFLEELR